MGRLKSIGNNTIFLELCLQEAIADVILYLKEGAGYDKWSNKCKSYRREASKPIMSQYESGQRLPSVPKLIQLAQYYNVSLDYLCGRTEER